MKYLKYIHIQNGKFEVSVIPRNLQKRRRIIATTLAGFLISGSHAIKRKLKNGLYVMTKCRQRQSKSFVEEKQQIQE